MLKTFIDRPVLSTVISIIIVFLGIIGLNTLPIEQYPDVAPPTVSVTTTYTGANASVVLNSVVIPLEEQINGVENMMYMESTAMNGGIVTITVYFNQGTDPDIAAVNVQNRVSRATPILPAEVNQQGVVVQKQQNSTILGFVISSTNEGYDDEFIQNYANINLIPQIQRVNGVGSAKVMGAKDYSMRIWIKPDVMSNYGVSVQEIIAALNDQNIEAAPGALGQTSSQAFEYALKYTGKYKTPEQFGDIILRSENGSILRLKDVADVQLGALSYVVNTKLNGKYPGVFCAISQTAGSNADQVIKDVKAVIAEAEKTMPEGVGVTVLMDASLFLDASIEKVLHTLLEAFILVSIVVFIFLQDLRSTIIPAIAIPVSVIGTFFMMKAFGFSINMITLFALVLAIGIVVDDAIVVVEAVQAQLEAGAKSAREATLTAMQEIAPAIVSITLVMSAVFIPVSFLPGTTGIFFKQFGITLACAIVISALNALTLSPALCAMFLKPIEHHGENVKKKGFMNRFFYSFNVMFNAATNKYKSSLKFLGKGKRWLITVGIIILSSGVFYGLNKMLPSDFVPNEDSGSIMSFVTLAPGSSLERTDAVVQEIMAKALAMEGVETATQIGGYNFMTGLGSSYASVVIKLIPWKDRKMTANQINTKLQQETSSIKDATLFWTVSPTLQGFGLSSGVQMQLQDKTNGDITKFYGVTEGFVHALQARKEVMIAMTNFDLNYPQIEISADIPKIKAAGLTLSDVMLTLQTYIGSYYANTFNLFGKQFKVMVQSKPVDRETESDLNNIYVKTGSGEMSPVSEFISLKHISAPQTLSRFNMYNTMDVMIIPNMMDGYNTGNIYQIINEMKDQYLGTDYTFEYAGMSREGANTGGQIILIFAICLIFVYLLLSALYESYIIPLAVLLSLPVGLAGVYIFILLFGVSQGIVSNIYVQIAMVMLIGLLAKNAILIVEYAIQRRQLGMSIVDAAVNGAVARLRPILMTSFAFIMGLLPLVFSTGAGAVGNKSLGLAAVGGMLIGTLIGVLVIPSLYIIFQFIQDKFSGVPKDGKKTAEIVQPDTKQ